MPVGDWQFWVVTVLAILAAWFIIRPILRKRRRGQRRKVKLTIGGKARP
jgi:flagellar biosynthesis/type III secretory pathway M-ring protein FliF/YscJ